MATTYTLISSNVLSSTAASVTFSAIPATYTDLVLRITARGTRVNQSVYTYIQFNSDTASNYSYTALAGDGAAASSYRGTSTTFGISGRNSAASGTSNTFSSQEIYIPSYTVSQNKPFSGIGIAENNTTTAYIEADANLWRNTAAITSILIYPANNDWDTGSSFYLYGIKNS